MKIIVENQKERQLIESLCDIALRAGGVKNLKEVSSILNSIENKKKEKKNATD